MNGHPTYKPKKKKAATGLFPMHEAVSKDAHNPNCRLFDWRTIEGCNCGYDIRNSTTSQPFTRRRP